MMATNDIEARIFDALDKLSRSSEDLLAVLSERMIWDGGIEKVFQGLFLWAFNSLKTQPCYYLAPELCCIDFLAFKSSPEVDRLVRSIRSCNDPRWYETASAFIEIKDIDNISKGLSPDIVKLREAAAASSQARSADGHLYEIVLLKDWHESGRLRQQWQEQLEEKAWPILSALGVGRECCISSKLLFEHKPSPSDNKALTSLAVLVIGVPCGSLGHKPALEEVD